MAGEDPCDRFLENVGGDAHFTTRLADQIIHEHTGYWAMSPNEQLAHHIAKQQEILDRFKGCEKKIFNDPAVKYPFRKHFNGKPGTMSNILTSGYFSLYDTLLRSELGIEVNALDDYITLFYLASSLNIIDGAFVIDSEEFEAMKRILRKLQSMLPETELFTREWFHEYRTFLMAVHSEALDKYSYYKQNMSHQTLGQAIEWKSPRLSKKEQGELNAKFFFGSYDHIHYEYYPPYMNPNFVSDLMETYIPKLSALQVLFTRPEEARHIDFMPGSPASGKKSTKKLRKGGSRRRTLKRKGNRLSARRRSRSVLQ